MALTQISTAGVKDDAVTSGKIPANAVGSSELADNAVDTAAIAADAVTGAKIADDAVGNEHLANNCVNTVQIADSQVTTNKIADDAVTTAKLAAGSVDNTALANNSINGNKLQDNCVATSEIQDEAVTLAKLPHGTSSNDGKFLRANNGADPTFETVTSTTINNNAATRVITGSGTSNTLEGNSDLLWNGSRLDIDTGGTEDALRIGNTAGTDTFIRLGSIGTNADTHAVIKYDKDDNYLSLLVSGESHGNGGVYIENGGKVRLPAGVKLGGSADTNLLDDYEEGTWTPDLRFGNGSSGMSYSVRSGTYTKVGNTVHWRFRITLSNKGSSTGHAQVFGLPFVASNSNQGQYAGGFVCYAAGLTNSSRWSANQTPTIDTNNTYVFLRYVITGIDYSSNHNNASMTNSTDLILAGHYVTDS